MQLCICSTVGWLVTHAEGEKCRYLWQMPAAKFHYQVMGQQNASSEKLLSATAAPLIARILRTRIDKLVRAEVSL